MLGAVDVGRSDTLCEVRSAMEKEWDRDQLPRAGWFFVQEGVRVSRKQEAQRSAWSQGCRGVVSIQLASNGVGHFR